MSEIKFTGKNTLIYLLTLIKNNFVKKDGNKVLSDNNLSNELLEKINTNVNTIETVSVNNTKLIPDDSKNINITIPQISTDITADNASDTKTTSPKAVAQYVTKAISSIQGIEYKILVEGEYENGVPSLISGAPGVIYLVPNGETSNNSYIEFIWDGFKFEKIGTTDVNLDGYLLESELVEFTNEEIDEIYASLA